MEKFRTKLKRRMWISSGMIIVALALGLIRLYTVNLSDDSTISAGFIAGFQFGLIMSLGLLSLIDLIRSRQALKDEFKLKTLYNKEHDERLKSIRSKAGMPMIQATSILMLIAAIIAGYFNITVFYTLVIALSAQLLLSAMVKLFCLRTM